VKQTQKNLVLLAGMVGATLLLGLYAYFGVMKPEEQATEKKASDEKLIAVSKGSADGGADVTFQSLVVQAKGDTTTLERQNGTWTVTSPIQWPADAYTVDTLVSQLQSTSIKSVVEENPTDADLEKYGLKPPKFSVKAYVKLPGESQVKELLFEGGIENNFDGSVYLRRQGDKRVFSAPGGLRFSLQKSTLDLRDKVLFTSSSDDIQGVEVASKTTQYALERQGTEKDWKLTRPTSENADGPGVETNLEALANLRAVDFRPDTPEERKMTGLDTPELTVTFTLKNGGKAVLRQASVASQNFVFVEAPGRTVLAEVGGTNLSVWNKPVAELKDKRLVQVNRADIARAVFKPEGAGPELVIQRAPADAGTDEWDITAPTQERAKRLLVTSAFYALENFRATGTGPSNPKDWTAFGLGPKARAITLFDAKGKVLARLELGSAVPNKTNTVYARTGRNQVLEVSSASLSQLPSQPSDLTNPVRASPPEPGGMPPNVAPN
jgi:hypothetical protein